MKITCLLDNLKKGIMSAERIIGKNLTLPILSNIHLEAKKGGLEISSTNLEIGVTCKTRAKVEREGKIAIPGRIIGGFLGQLDKEGKVIIETKDNSLFITCHGNKAVIKGVSAKDFPLIPKPHTQALIEINSAEFQEKVNKILPCVATSEARQELTGVLITFLEEKLVLAATDSFRLAESVIKLEKNNIFEDYKRFLVRNNTIIVPARTLVEVLRNITSPNDKLKIFLGENQIFFKIDDDILFVSRLIDGKYPEYRLVIPKKFSSNVLVKREEFIRVVKLASIFSDSKNREIKVEIKKEKNKMTILAQSLETGENASEINCRANVKSDSEIAFNSRYILDALNVISSPSVFIGFNDAFGPVIFKEITSEGKIKDDYLHIIMPIKS